VYGSSNAGATVFNSSTVFNEQMEKIAERLNLRPHLCGVGAVEDCQRLHLAADIEGHRGIDDRFYLLDLARAFPPEYPLNDLVGI
jgi:Clustered mitochondria